MDRDPPIDVAGRQQVLVEAEQLWRCFPDHRFGQMLVQAVGVVFGASVDADLSVYDNEQWKIAFERRREDFAGREPERKSGPHWDTESRTDRTFVNGLPRDPDRIDPFMKALGAAWDCQPSLPLGGVITKASGGWRAADVEDGALLRGLESLAQEQSIG